MWPSPLSTFSFLVSLLVFVAENVVAVVDSFLNVVAS